MAERKNSRRKGNKAEREVCKWFKQWTGYDFARVPSSGGLRWKRVNDTVGDITCTDKTHGNKFPFTIESKSYKTLDILPVVIGNKMKIEEFWEQAKADGIRGNKEPLLFMRYNGMKANTYFVLINEDTGKLIIDLLDHKFNYPIIKVTKSSDKYYIISSEDMVRVDYKKIYKVIRKKLKR